MFTAPGIAPWVNHSGIYKQTGSNGHVILQERHDLKLGFGFNSGNFAQDICLNGAYVEASSIAPDTPLLATLDPVTPDCRNTAAVSRAKGP